MHGNRKKNYNGIRQIIFESLDSIGAGFFPIENKKFLRYGRRENMISSRKLSFALNIINEFE